MNPSEELRRVRVGHIDWLEGRHLAAILRYEYIARFGLEAIALMEAEE